MKISLGTYYGSALTELIVLLRILPAEILEAESHLQALWQLRLPIDRKFPIFISTY